MSNADIYNTLTDPRDCVALLADTVGNAGGGGSHNNTQPYLALNYIVCISGLFPPRP
jgi:microcystin-dependent protein